MSYAELFEPLEGRAKSFMGSFGYGATADSRYKHKFTCKRRVCVHAIRQIPTSPSKGSAHYWDVYAKWAPPSVNPSDLHYVHCGCFEVNGNTSDCLFHQSIKAKLIPFAPKYERSELIKVNLSSISDEDAAFQLSQLSKQLCASRVDVPVAGGAVGNFVSEPHPASSGDCTIPKENLHPSGGLCDESMHCDPSLSLLRNKTLSQALLEASHFQLKNNQGVSDLRMCNGAASDMQCDPMPGSMCPSMASPPYLPFMKISMAARGNPYNVPFALSRVIYSDAKIYSTSVGYPSPFQSDVFPSLFSSASVYFSEDMTETSNESADNTVSSSQGQGQGSSQGQGVPADIRDVWARGLDGICEGLGLDIDSPIGCFQPDIILT